LTAEQLLANPGKYEGKMVAIEAAPEPGPVRCTLMVCSQENPCCNSCGSSLVIKSSRGDILIEGGSCKGDECSLSCSPFAQGEKASISGIFKASGSGYAIELQNE